MITLTVISFNGAPASSVQSVVFDELGGTIGRADTNQLVLEDPDRTISRVHAQVVYRNGGFAVVDRGSNPISVNGRAVGNGREVPLAEGDQLQVGGYVLSVKAAAATAAGAMDDPFADLLGTPTGHAPLPAAGSRPPAAPIDPLAAFDFAPQSPPGPAARPPSQAAAAPASVADDWDPFAADRLPAKPAAPALDRSLGRQNAGSFGLDIGAAAPAALIPDLSAMGTGNDNSLDRLFGLKPGTGGDPLANSALDNPIAKPNMAASSDPLQSLGSVARATAATASDAFSDLQRPFITPPSATPPKAPAAPAAAAAAAPVVPKGAVLSWDSQGGEGHTVIRAGTRPIDAPTVAAAHPVAPAPKAAADTVQATVAAPAVKTSVASPAPATQAAASAEAGALLSAFREGLAMPTVPVDALTPELMRLIGQLLHEAARGTVDLLVARAALKREVRAEATMIVAKENNPLKFSPSVDAALLHLLSPPTRGFMPAATAMRDAYDDLRAHQFGFIAGMRAALEGVLARFDPSELEGRLTQRSMLESLLPGSRKARMWGVFVEHFEQISNEASDDFHTLFGKAFLKAYEEHIDQLKRGAT